MICGITELLKVKALGTFVPLKIPYRLLRRGLGSALAVVLLLTATQAYALTNVSGTIAADTTWDAANGPYVLTGGVTIPSGVTLTLSPGTVVKGQQYGWLLVDGTLNANGTASQPIVFTSLSDDTYGGDTNGDGNASAPAAGNWAGIAFNSTSANSQLSYAVVKYTGTYLNNYSGIFVNTSSLSISNSTISDGST